MAKKPCKPKPKTSTLTFNHIPAAYEHFTIASTDGGVTWAFVDPKGE